MINIPLEKLKRVQERLRKRLMICPLGAVKTIASTDVAYGDDDLAFVSVISFSYPNLELKDYGIKRSKVSFPYISGYLSFREVPLILKALKGLKERPDLIMCDGQGIAHPMGLGLASHLGVLLNIPTIGVGKSILVGRFSGLGEEKGCFAPIYYQGKEVGAALRTRKGVKPIFVSPGHKVDLASAMEVVMASLRGYRIPEPIRMAHNLAVSFKVARSRKRDSTWFL